jgi:hypothetical protein
MTAEHPAERHKEQRAMLAAALDAHPALKKLPQEERPLPYLTPDVVGLDYGHGRERISFRIQDKRWWGDLNQFRARQLADDLVNGLRERIREAKRARK